MLFTSRSDKSPAVLVVIGVSIATTALAGGGGYWWWRQGADRRGQSTGSTSSDPPHASAKPVTMIVSGDTAGWIVPCGCTSNQSGGLPRRSTFVAERRQASNVIVADVGGAAGGSSLYHRARFEAILDGELAMGIAAHNLGGPEILLGVDYLRKLASSKQVPFLSANVCDATGRRAVEAYRIIDVGGVRLLLVGVARVYVNIAGKADWRLDDPRSAVLAALDDAAGKFDRVVVLAYLNETDLRELAGALPEVDAVIGGPTGQSLAPTRVGPVLVASATNKGKFLVSLPLAADRRQQAPPAAVVELSDRFADDPAQFDVVRSFRKELGRRDFNAAETGLTSQFTRQATTGFQIAGSDACRACHADEYSIWNDSQHARAWQTLLVDDVHVDPACQLCHTTGYGQPGGFQSLAKSDNRVAVGCESCHGPSQAHVERPRQRTSFVAREQCTHCHDHENSPRFELESYWKQIVHGKHAPD